MNLLSKNIIYLVVLFLSASFLIIMLSQQRTYLCLDNLEKIKSRIEYMINYVEGYHSNIILKIEMPQNFEYNIYSDGKDVYLYDLSCNIRIKINYNVTLLGEIYSKKFFYIIKNNTEIYLSPKELDIPPGIKEDFVSIYSIQTTSQSTTPKNQIQQQDQQTENIFLIFIRSSKFGGRLISNNDLKLYAQLSTEHLKNAFIESFPDLYPFNLSNAYKYLVIEDRYIDTVLEECFTGIECQRAFMIFQSVCNNIKNAHTIAFVIMVNDASLPYSGVSFLSYAIKQYFYNLKHYSGCNANIITFIQINTAYATPSVLTHELGHAIGNLYDQYLNGCNSLYLIDLKENKIIDYVKFLEKNNNIICNKLEKSLGAEVSNLITSKIDEIYNKYKISFIDKDYLKDEICFGKNAIMIYKNGFYIIMLLSGKPDSYEYDLSTECNMILIDENSGNVEYGDCHTIIKKYNLNIDVYEDQISLIEKVSLIGICIGNLDIFKKGRDIMYTLGPKYYFSLTSISAFKNNIKKIWG